MRTRARPAVHKAIGPTASPPRRPANPPLVEHALDLQRTAGNAAVVHALQRQAAVAEAETGVARKTVGIGSNGDDVYYLQSRLNRAPEVTIHLAVDGQFGPATRRAVREFQKAHPPLEVDGIVGPLTWPEVEGIADEPADDAKRVARRSSSAAPRPT